MLQKRRVCLIEDKFCEFCELEFKNNWTEKAP